MPGMMPQMPGIMGAPMGPPPGMPPMGGMPGMPPMPMGGMPPPMPPMGGPLGGAAPGPQGGRPASLGTLPSPSTAEQRAGFGAAVGAVASGPVAGAFPADVFAGGIPGGMMDASIPRPVAMMRDGGVARMQDGGLVIQRNADGSASILFPGGGISTVRPTPGIDPVQALQQTYGDRISSVTSSGRTASELAAQQREVRAADELATVAATLANQPKYGGGAATGFDPTQVSGYLGSMAGQLAAPETSADRYVTEAASQGANYLSRYLPPEQVAGMTQRQLLAANELMTQGGGVKESNYLSNEDLDFILNKANDFQGAVWSPVGQAISLGAGSGEASRYSGPQVSAGVTSGGAQPSGGGGTTFVSPYEPALSPIVAQPVPVSQPGGGIMNALPGDVMGTFAGPMMGSVYQPTVSQIPTFVSGASDVFGTRPVTYVTSPQATIRSRLGEIDLPARPESVNVFDWLSTPVAGFGGTR